MAVSVEERSLPESLWTVQQLADFFTVPLTTIYKWRHQGKGPKAFRVGKHLRYDPVEVATWLKGRAEK